MCCSAIAASTLSLIAMGANAAENDPQVTKALGFKPRQPNVVYDVVAPDDVEKCTSRYEKKDGNEGLSIYGPGDQLLRRFTDLNSDRQVDQWCYYKDGIEVYRDIDSDFNSTADQYRWLGTNGTRWAIDKDEDGTIDSWKSISPEEVTIEVIESIKTKNANRFQALVLTKSEIESLGLGGDKAGKLQERVAETKSSFAEFVRSQKLISSSTKWAHFAADKPGVVPAGTDGASKDITAYENVIAIVDNEGTSQQLLVGTMVQAGNVWKITDCPKAVMEGSTIAEGGFFFPVVAANRVTSGAGSSGGMSQAMQALLVDLEKIDSQIQAGPDAAKLTSLHESRAQLLLKLVEAAGTSGDAEQWGRQFVDSTSSAAMQGQFPKGIEFLRMFEATLANMPVGKTLLPYVVYRALTTEFQVESSKPDSNFSRLQDRYLENLEEFVEAYPNSPEVADAMVQIAVTNELLANMDKARVWFDKASTKFPETTEGKKARGALNRLNLVGRKFAIAGKTLDNKSVETGKLAGRPIVVHYWASWCSTCRPDIVAMQKQLSRRPNSFHVVGINMDNDAKVAKESLPEGAGNWPHIHDAKGFDSELAIGLGVFSPPVTVLIDQEGIVSVCATNFVGEIETKLEAMLAAGNPGGNANAANKPKPAPAPNIPNNAKVNGGTPPNAKNSQQPPKQPRK
jgi:thiol-disulfide isomerase/thioredoxin